MAMNQKASRVKTFWPFWSPAWTTSLPPGYAMSRAEARKLVRHSHSR
jgi:hypothetical protein